MSDDDYLAEHLQMLADTHIRTIRAGKVGHSTAREANRRRIEILLRRRAHATGAHRERDANWRCVHNTNGALQSEIEKAAFEESPQPALPVLTRLSPPQAMTILRLQ